jgi:hypothetical protein
MMELTEHWSIIASFISHFGILVRPDDCRVLRRIHVRYIQIQMHRAGVKQQKIWT